MIQLKSRFIPYQLQFKFEAGTSRGVLTEKFTSFLIVSVVGKEEVIGIGECGPLRGLSPDDKPDFEIELQQICNKINNRTFDKLNPEEIAENLVPANLPSIRFGLETALYDLLNGGEMQIFRNSFSSGKAPIEINGLVWMGKKEFMLKQIDQKIAQGYNCIKMKIGAIDFEEECNMLAYIRDRFDASKITIRVDANGAFAADEALNKLKRLAAFDIHSIEQPIKAGQINEMAKLCAETPLPIALDEELIGVNSTDNKAALLDQIKPQYIILKPTLVGGFKSCREWIKLAVERKIDWWITSALESNIGLNAISQFTATFNNPLPQGLGTGQLYHNNISSPLNIKNGNLYYDTKKAWDLSAINH